MKKILVAAAALTALAGAPAIAADLGRPMPAYKAPPPPAPVYSWTGCYLGGGGGYGMWNQDMYEESFPGLVPLSLTTTAGGRGWFATVQVGCDYQFAGDWLIGAFADWDVGNLKGTPELPNTPLIGREKQKWAWAAGGRLGYLVLPQLLAFVSVGFTEAHFDAITLVAADDGDSAGEHLPAHTYHGWFLGTGYEYALKWLPGWFWKTEYRYAQYRGADLAPVFDIRGADLIDGDAFHMRKFEQVIRSELVWRFNWGGPVRAAY